MVAPVTSTVAVIGDCHGHLQLALGVAALWQEELGVQFEAVFLCGDVGTFVEESQLDGATRRHARNNPCELEFLQQWSTSPPAPWLEFIFKPRAAEGLGLTCPVVMVHGNHEGFAHLERLTPGNIPPGPVTPADLPGVDTAGYIRYLPSGWCIRLSTGAIVAGIGGMERGQRTTAYHPQAYIDEDAVYRLLGKEVTLLLTHQGPAAVQGDHGSPTLQPLLDAGAVRLWFHGHSTPQPNPTDAGPDGRTLVVPLGDIAFPMRGPKTEEPGRDGWALVTLSALEATVAKTTPACLSYFRRNRWMETHSGLLIAPPLAPLAWTRQWMKL